MATHWDIQEQIQDVQEEREYQGLHGTISENQRQMMEAVRSKNLEKVRRLMNRGVDTTFSDSFGNSPLHVIVGMYPNKRVSDIVQMLVYFGTSLNMQNRFGLTPLHIASKCSADHVQTLLEAGCALDIQDNAGRTAVMQTCMSDSKEALVVLQLLMDRGANVFISDGEGMNALHYLCQNGHQDDLIRNEMMYKLLYTGLSTAVRDKRGRLPIQYEVDQLKVTSARDLCVFRSLIQSGPNTRRGTVSTEPWIGLLQDRSDDVLPIVFPTLCQVSLRLMIKAASRIHNGPRPSNGLQAKLKDLGNTVTSLKAKCRVVVRKQLAGEMFVKTSCLGLPRALEEYLLLKS